MSRVYKWIWIDGDLYKIFFNCRVGKIYPSLCSKQTMVCNPVATAFGDECGNENCKKVS